MTGLLITLQAACIYLALVLYLLGARLSWHHAKDVRELQKSGPLELADWVMVWAWPVIIVVLFWKRG